MRIKVIIPNSGMDRATLDEREVMLSQYCWEGTTVSVDCIDSGPESIESEYDEVLAGPYVLEKAFKAQDEGYDALIVYCGSDPAVDAVREVLDIPVIGPGKASKLMALDLSRKFSVLTVLSSCIPVDQEKAHRQGIPHSALISIRAIDVPVSNVRDDLDKTFEALYAAGKKCIEEDGAQCLVLACLGMAGMGERLTGALGIPVLDPAPISMQYAQTLVKIGLSHSRLAYPSPPDKLRI